MIPDTGTEVSVQIETPVIAVDEQYRSALVSIPDVLGRSYKDLVSSGCLPIDGNEVTKAILLRMKAYYEAQNRVKLLLGKRIATAAADFLVETILFYLKALAETHKLGLEVASERPLSRKRRALRPDISIWRKDSLVAVVECKTQLGWHRHRWEAEFLKRKQAIAASHPDALCFLVVMTTENWGGFENDDKLGAEYFALSCTWPTAIDPRAVDVVIVSPIEGLFRRIQRVSERT